MFLHLMLSDGIIFSFVSFIFVNNNTYVLKYMQKIILQRKLIEYFLKIIDSLISKHKNINVYNLK